MDSGVGYGAGRVTRRGKKKKKKTSAGDSVGLQAVGEMWIAGGEVRVVYMWYCL